MESKTAELISQKLSSQELKKKEFKRTAWGYSPKEVADYLEEMAKTWEKFQAREKELTEKVKSLSEDLTRWKNREVEIVKLREKAVQEAEAIRDQAAQEAQRMFAEVESRANEIRGKTEEWLANVIAEVEETERQKSNFMMAFKSALDSHYALLQTEQTEAEPLGLKLNQFLKTTLSSASRN